MGRSSDYTAEIAAEICRRLATGQTLRAVCRDDSMPAESTVRGWVLDDREGFSAQYARAREIGYHSMADEVIDIADDAAGDLVIDKKTGNAKMDGQFAERARIRVDARKWLLSKALPKIYGDRLNVDAKHDVSDGLAELLKAIDGKTRGLPSADPPATVSADRSMPSDFYFVMFGTPEWAAHQAHRAQNGLPPLVPVTIEREGAANRGAMVPSALP